MKEKAISGHKSLLDALRNAVMKSSKVPGIAMWVQALEGKLVVDYKIECYFTSLYAFQLFTNLILFFQVPSHTSPTPTSIVNLKISAFWCTNSNEMMDDQAKIMPLHHITVVCVLRL